MPGHCGGPGRPPKEHVAAYLTIARDACGPSKWRAICERAVEDAIGGDAVARGWVTRTLGLVDAPALGVELGAGLAEVVGDPSRTQHVAELLDVVFAGRVVRALPEPQERVGLVASRQAPPLTVDASSASPGASAEARQ